MTEKPDQLAASGARFCGEMNASISHEIKNVMAIINENAGLLADMVALHQQGVPFDDARIARLSRSVSRQIARANEIIGVMNRFAHSADKPYESVDVGETVQFMLALTDRLVTMQGIRVDLLLPDQSVTVAASRFYLQFVIWRCLQAAMRGSSPGDTIQLFVQAAESSSCLAFCGVATGDDFPEAPLVDLEASGILALLGARMTLRPAQGEFQVRLGGDTS
jgi:C4-dicarboxylate-specific signal transduction histidine kinase